MAASVAEIMDNEQEKGCGSQIKVHFNVTSKETDSLSRSSSSSSSSLSDSSMESVVIDKELRSDPHLESRGPVPLPLPEAPFETSLEAQSPPPLQAPPPIQIMATTAGYDPNRIPFSIFTPKPANPTDWSVASNESLFSIHMGNNSFSRDHFILANRSGELPMFSESNNILAPLSPVSEEAKDETRKENMENALEERGVVTTEANKVAVANMALRDHTKEHMPPIDEARSYVSVSCQSDESNNSTRSFHFPVFAGDGARSSSVTAGSYAQNSESQGPDSQTQEGTPNSVVNWFYSFSCCLPCRCRCP